MIRTSAEERRRLARLERPELERRQLERLNQMLAAVLPHNRFYAEKLARAATPLASLADLAQLPFTLKDELALPPQSGELAANLTYPPECYVRFHRTSGTHGRPLAVLDTPDDWQWWLDVWQFILDAAEIGPEDRAALAFSFGPFIGFWSAHDALVERRCLVIPTGGMTTLARLELIRGACATALFCTPSYALRLAEVAAENQIDTAALDVRRIVVAGEPGGSLATLRRQIESTWNARVIDHAGASEVGPWGFADPRGRGLHVLETEFIAEFISLETGGPAEEGELSELVLTSLGRWGSPVIRYRTGDLVRPLRRHDEPCRFVLLDGGIISRADDMRVVRGVNVFPSALDLIVRGFPEVVEYRALVRKSGAMDELAIEIEDRLQRPERVALELQVRLGLKVEVRCVPLGSLPRFEGKGKRFLDQR